MNPQKIKGGKVEDSKPTRGQVTLKLPDLKDDEILDFANATTKISWMSGLISRSDYKHCKGWKCYHPSNFHVLLAPTYWNMMEENQKHLNAFYDKKCITNKDGLSMIVKDDPRFKLETNEKSNYKDLFVAAYFLNEWFRGFVLKYSTNNDTKKHICKVLLIDFGTHYNIPAEFIRRIPVGLLTHFPAQAIRCSLQFDGHAKLLNDSDYMWTRNEAHYFEKIMQDCNFMVEFVNTEKYPKFPENDVVWKVRVKIYETLEKVADKFLETLQRKYQEKEEKKMREEELNGTNVDADEGPWSFVKCFSIYRIEKSRAWNMFVADFEAFIASNEADTEQN